MTGEFFLALLKLLVAFPLVLLLIYVFFKFVSQKQKLFNVGKYIRIIEEVPVAPKAFLAVAQIGQNYVVLSITESTINILQEIPAEEVLLISELFEQEAVLPPWAQNLLNKIPTDKIPGVKFRDILKKKTEDRAGESDAFNENKED